MSVLNEKNKKTLERTKFSSTILTREAEMSTA